MSYEHIQKVTASGVDLIEKPKILNLETWEQYTKWKQITIFPYSSKKEKMPFIQIKNNVLYAYNYGDYKWIVVYSELITFFNNFDFNSKGEKRTFKQTYDNFAYHLNKIKEDKHYHYIEDRGELDRTKKFRSINKGDTTIILIPYTTFWALLESYNSQIGKNILKQLHQIDYERMLSDEKQQTLIEQIKGEKALSQILFEEIDKCETLHQIGLFTHLFKFFPQARVEVRFYDPDKEWEWSLDILIGNLVLELDGTQHRFKDERFDLDEAKDTFNFENGRSTFRRSNGWWERNFKKFPLMVEKFMTHHKDLL